MLHVEIASNFFLLVLMMLLTNIFMHTAFFFPDESLTQRGKKALVYSETDCWSL